MQTTRSAPALQPYQIKPLVPFGAEVFAPKQGSDLRNVSAENLKDWVTAYDLVVLKGFAPLEGDAFPNYCSAMGEILEWSFGAVNNLNAQEDAKNYLFTNRAVPFHWDGAFAGRIPHWIIFHCDSAPPPGTGGETLFCNTPLLLQCVSGEERAAWRKVSITYSTEKVAHYGGTFTSPLVARHPLEDREILRYAEPVEDLNPVLLEITGVDADRQDTFLAEMHRLLNDSRFCCAHAWETGDIVIADNFNLLHGRRAFSEPASRHLRRVNVL